jgi:hypothetical protein
MNKKVRNTVTPLEAREIFNQACRFLGTDQLLRKVGTPGSGWKMTIVVPTSVLSAFAAELFLKCLLVLERGNALPIHRLDVLFKNLPHKRQRRIQEIWESDARPKLRAFCLAKGLPSDLSNALAKCGNAFENLRYYYEDPNKVRYYIGDFAWILMRAIVEIEPEWVPPDPPPIPKSVWAAQ